MDVREKLVKLIESARYWGSNTSEEIADNLLENGVTVQEWISVDERLPVQLPNRVDEQGRYWFTPDIDCIVYDGKNVFAAHYCFQNKCFWYADTLHPLKNITHWMPLHPLPKGGNMQ